MRFMFNEDSDHFIISRKASGEKITKKELVDFILQYEGTGITDFVLNINCRVSSAPSKIFDSVIDRYEIAERENKLEEYNRGFDISYDLFIKQGIDMYKIWIDTLRRINMHPWLSFRMNDCHDSYSTDPVITGAFYQEYPEQRRAAYRRCVSQSDFCYNYAMEEVRTRMCAYIEEMLERYDVDGIEIDFSREAVCFVPGQENGNIITALMENIDSIRKSAEAKYSHNIQISVLVPCKPLSAQRLGFQVNEWAQKGLVDIVVPISRWASTDTDIPVSMWKEWVYPAVPEVIAGHQILLRSCFAAPVAINSYESAIGAAAGYLGEGSDGTYLYNYMDRIKEFLYDSTGWKTDLCDPELLHRLLCTLGEPEKIIQSDRRHVLTLSDAVGYWEHGRSNLPITCQQNDYYFSLRIPIGEVPKKAEVFVILAMASEDLSFGGEDVEVWLSGNKCTFETVGPVTTHCSDNPGYVYRVAEGFELDKVGMIEFTSIHKKRFVVDYAEIYIVNSTAANLNK